MWFKFLSLSPSLYRVEMKKIMFHPFFMSHFFLKIFFECSSTIGLSLELLLSFSITVCFFKPSHSLFNSLSFFFSFLLLSYHSFFLSVFVPTSVLFFILSFFLYFFFYSFPCLFNSFSVLISFSFFYLLSF